GFARNDRNAASCGVGVVVVFFLLTVPPGEMSERILLRITVKEIGE
ncbi:hypothetical protein QYL43_004981, partial [Escherichia coli]|nr:hypothetical protein [Escherichia coli]